MQYSILNGYVEGIFFVNWPNPQTHLQLWEKSNLDVSMQLNVAKN